MPKLILIKHAMPTIQEGIAAHRWPLSEQGRRDSRAFAETLRPFAPTVIICSEEPKAAATGAELAAALALPYFTAAGLHEHERPEPVYLARDAFEAQVSALFARPETLVFGAETAAALERFRGAVWAALRAHPNQTAAIVAHGTVITLLTAAHNAIDPFALWQRLKLPSLVALELPTLRLLEVVEGLGG
jgi:broad specificity phosphatase PhoE